MSSSHLPLVLIVEDELPIRRFLSAALADSGYRINEAASAEESLNVARDPVPDLIMLDLGLPDVDGQQLILQLREWYVGPILVVSARDQEAQKIRALDSGADDYVTKPFGIGEVLARVRTLLRRYQHAPQPDAALVRFGEIEVDLINRIVKRAAEVVHLTPLEYKMLLVFVKHPHKVLTHRFLLQEVWGHRDAEELHYVRVFVSSLRKKLEVDPSRPKHFLNEAGVGYRLAD